MMSPCRVAGRCLETTSDPGLVWTFRRDLSALGFLRRGIDGEFGPLTQAAVQALQFDLLDNDGSSNGKDGGALGAIKSFSHRMRDVTDVGDSALADSIEVLFVEERASKLPSSSGSATANRTVRAETIRAVDQRAPMPFMLSDFQPESRSQHFAVPKLPGNEGSYVIVELDRDQKVANQIVSPGYEIDQDTLSHHPPRSDERGDFITAAVRNVQKEIGDLAGKRTNSGRGVTYVRDYRAEHPLQGSLRLCRHGDSGRNYMTACKDCTAKAGKRDLGPDIRLYRGARRASGQTSDYRPTTYRGVPNRVDPECDWPCAMRRCHGCGSDPFNYRAIVLGNLRSASPKPDPADTAPPQ